MGARRGFQSGVLKFQECSSVVADGGAGPHQMVDVRDADLVALVFLVFHGFKKSDLQTRM